MRAAAATIESAYDRETVCGAPPTNDDALGSVVALSDSAGDTVQLYEYDVYGQPAASDPNHTNPFLFTGRRYDTETGLYYYRARHYNCVATSERAGRWVRRFSSTASKGDWDGPYVP